MKEPVKEEKLGLPATKNQIKDLKTSRRLMRQFFTSKSWLDQTFLNYMRVMAEGCRSHHGCNAILVDIVSFRELRYAPICAPNCFYFVVSSIATKLSENVGRRWHNSGLCADAMPSLALFLAIATLKCVFRGK